jgi:2-keto-4-pentenoate hydratase
VTDVDPRFVSALAEQLESWRTALDEGAERIGWKLGLGERERIGAERVIGHLTSATRLEDGAAYSAGNAVALNADVEIALELGSDVRARDRAYAAREASAGYGAALELVDLGGQPDDAEGIVAGNVYHRAFVLGAFRPTPRSGGVEARLLVNGEVRRSAVVTGDLVDKVRVVARALEAVGERLRAGDRIITGSILQVGVRPGDDLIADLGAFGRVGLVIAP